MNDADRSLADILQRTAPEPPENLDFDALAVRVRRRRTRTAMVSGGGAVLATIAVIGALAQVDRQPTDGGVAPIASGDPSPTPALGCPETRPYPNGRSVLVDYKAFIILGGQDFQVDQVPPMSRDDLGAQVATVSCRISDLTEGGRMRIVARFPDEYLDGNSAYLDVGTPIYAVDGFAPSCRVAVIEEGKVVPYLAHHAVNGHSAPLECALTPSQAPANEPVPTSGTITGQLAWVGGPAPGTAVRHPGRIHVASVDGRYDRTAEADADGHWELTVPPGTYTVRATSPGYLSAGGVEDACRTESDEITVKAGSTTAADVYCQLG